MLKAVPNRTLEFYGKEFPYKLFNRIIGDKIKVDTKIQRDTKFGGRILRILNKDHFEDSMFKELLGIIVAYQEKFDTIPYYDELEVQIKTKSYNDVVKNSLLVVLKEIYNYNNDLSYSTEAIEIAATKFVQTHNLLLVAKKFEELALSGQYEDYDKVVDSILTTISISDVEETHYITESGNYDDLTEPRLPYPIGWGEGFDKALNGGLARGELMIAILGSGVGKTTLATVAADYIFNLGLNVVQVFFEDTKQQIRQKQRAKWTGLPINQISKLRQESSEFVKKASDDKILKANEKGGHWVLKKFKSTGTTPNDLRKYLKKLKTQYKIEPHFVIIDYLECLDVDREYDDDWKKEKQITRHLESIASEDEFNVAMIAFTQGNRGAMNNEFVDVTEMGGDFSKYKIGHVVMSMAKTHEMKRKKVANAAILKSRVGADGIVFKSFAFDNSTLRINITPQSVSDLVDAEYTPEAANFAKKKQKL